jgi:hypothetical protein
MSYIYKVRRISDGLFMGPTGGWTKKGKQWHREYAAIDAIIVATTPRVSGWYAQIDAKLKPEHLELVKFETVIHEIKGGMLAVKERREKSEKIRKEQRESELNRKRNRLKEQKKHIEQELAKLEK